MSVAGRDTLLIESGNSAWKAALWQQSELITAIGRGPDVQSLRQWLTERAERRIVLATVGAEAEAVNLVTELQDQGYEVYRVQTDQAEGFTHCYQEPGRLGVDRWLAMLAVLHENRDLVVLDLGTALTLDVLSQRGRHLGGWIAPGFLLMQESLVRRSTRLKVMDEAPAEALGTSTESAIALGCAASLQGFCQQALLLATQTLGHDNFEIYLTGGGVRHLDRQQLPAHHHRPHLVLEGLYTWCQEQLEFF
ncbi:MAG: type III pantothenate kinase [Idiomarina sp.]|nr:type III pantothenate kinase [Idiomarina sp.]